MPIDRSRYDEELAAAHKQSYDSRDDSGKYKSIFKDEAKAAYTFWKCPDGEHQVNFLPFVAGPDHPTVKEGKITYVEYVFIHRAIGVGENNYVCMFRTFGEACPICEEQIIMQKGDDFDEDEVKELNATKRAIYVVEVLDDEKEMAKGPQIWDVSHHLFDKQLQALAQRPRGGGLVPFAHPEKGKMVSFQKKATSYKTKKGMQKSTEFTSLQFLDREFPISQELLDVVPALDQTIYLPTYDEVKDAFHSGRNAVREEETFRKAGATDAKKDETDVLADKGIPPKKEEPKHEEKKPDLPPPVQEAATVATTTRTYRCPAGGTFGSDNNTFVECDGCRVFDPCKVAYSSIPLASKPAEEKKPDPLPAQEQASSAPPSAGGVRRRPGR